MIRRDVNMPGQPDRWMLISQVEHARLAYELARDWGVGGVQPLEPRDELLAAILHHDGGWAQWEEAPDVDSELGRPLSFLEMPIDEAVGIWGRSIAIAAEAGPLSAYVVAGHFATLVGRAREVHASDPPWLATACRFLDQQAHDRARWLADWQAGGNRGEWPPRSRELADRGLAQLQLFDALSLWFCLAEQTQALVVSTPQGPELTWSPTAPGEVTVMPWPWSSERVELQVSGRLIPVGHYTDRLAVARAPCETVSLQWRIGPHGS